MSEKWKKFVPWFLVVLSLLLILGLTLQDEEGTTELSGGFLEKLIQMVQMLGISEEQLNLAWWNDPGHVRKLGHVLEYFILGLSSAFLFCKRGKKFVLKALVFCAVVSILDQILKECLPTRHFDITDLPYDFVGYGSGVLVVVGVWGIWCLVKGRQDKLKKGLEHKR